MINRFDSLSFLLFIFFLILKKLEFSVCLCASKYIYIYMYNVIGLSILQHLDVIRSDCKEIKVNLS